MVRRGNHGVLALRNMRQGVSAPMNSTALPAGAERARDGVAQPVMGIRDHQLDALEATLHQPFKESRPERLRLRWAEAKAKADDLAAAFGRNRNGNSTETMRPPSRTLR